MNIDELLRRADMWLSEFHNKGGVTVPDDSYLAIIRDLASALRNELARSRTLVNAAVVATERAERSEAALLSVTSQREHATTMLAAWEQVWDGIRENHVPSLREDNKPLAVAASYEIAIRDRDSLRVLLRESSKWLQIDAESPLEMDELSRRIDAALEGK